MSPKSKITTVYTKDIANSVASVLRIAKKDATEYTETVITVIVENLLAGNKVNINALGIMQIKDTNERKVRNPKTGELSVRPPGKKFTTRATSVFKKRFS